MAVDFNHDIQVERHSFPSEKGEETGIATSEEITGIELRLSKAHIIDNKTPKVLVFPGFAKIYFLVIVASDVANSVPTIDLKSFPKVGDDESIPIDRSIYFWKPVDEDSKSPSQIHALVSIVKSKESLRDMGNVMTELNKDEEYGALVTSFKQVITSVNAVTQVSGILTSVAGVVGKFLGKVDDKPLITVVHSFTDINGDFDNLGKTTTPYSTDYAQIDLSLIIRDTTREKEKAIEQNVDLDDTDLNEE